MKIIDMLFALFCGAIVAQIASEFLKGYGFKIGYYEWFLYFAFPVISLICLWLAYFIGKKLLWVWQAAKYFLVGVFATIVDLKLFELLVWINPIISKVISFLISVSVKYWGNKHWTFEKPEKEGIWQEIFQFIIVTIVGLGIDVGSFFYFTNLLGPQLGTPENVWVKLSVIFAALVAAIWNFVGYKFLVFKK
ncbi:MAG: hypothetical protein A2904_02420 [Candidatus Staskawiczbacteria bacterium RIFCSPLOWO2_01_FULL_33_9]|uniref:GtrA/DPMS transmembrane domain-containing protein n=1 Tax=Candidatus Staskawiczbacteria bacterium RIFCSPLOWO2_01_FULL_33_9 TaxID=1802211 RepID=A0A1G2I673_9BACT|nr:MAG: hypothetical protein A2904_02420 [Candidatus Staskawiczbacteria bacterium RIFCSPLOWO2_01_FULL_33_9]